MNLNLPESKPESKPDIKQASGYVDMITNFFKKYLKIKISKLNYCQGKQKLKIKKK